MRRRGAPVALLPALFDRPTVPMPVPAPADQAALLAAVEMLTATTATAPPCGRATDAGGVCGTDDPCDACLAAAREGLALGAALARLAAEVPAYERTQRLAAAIEPGMLEALRGAAAAEHRAWLATFPAGALFRGHCACGAASDTGGPLCRLLRLASALAERPPSR